MSITLTCTCGKKLRPADEAAGKRVKCPTCGASLAVPKPEAAEEFDDFEVVEDEPAEAPPAPKPSAKKAAVKADEPEAVAPAPEQPAPEPKNPFANLGKKKKKKKKKKAAVEGDEDSVEKDLEAQDRMVRTVRGLAYVILGLAILGGFGYICAVHWQNVIAAAFWIQLPVYALPFVGLAALGKGAIGLAFGQFDD